MSKRTELNRQFTEVDIRMANKHMRMSLATRKCKLKPQWDTAHTRMAQNNEFISSVAEDVEKTELSHAVGEKCERGPLIQRRFWQFLIKGNPHPPCNPAISLPGVCHRTGTMCSQRSQPWDAHAAPHKCTAQHCSAVRRNRRLVQQQPERASGVLRWVRGQPWKTTYCMTPFIGHSWKEWGYRGTQSDQ